MIRVLDRLPHSHRNLDRACDNRLYRYWYRSATFQSTVAPLSRDDRQYQHGHDLLPVGMAVR